MRTRIGKIFKISIDIFLFLLVGIGILIVFSYIPLPGNFKIFTVQSGSMKPVLNVGDLIFVKQAEDYNVGDIVTRRTEDPKITITHRIVKKNEEGGSAMFNTKGDANGSADPEIFSKDLIIGKEITAISFLGYPVSFAKTTPGFIILIIIPGIVIIYDELHKIKNEVKSIHARRKERKDSAKNEENESEA